MAAGMVFMWIWETHSSRAETMVTSRRNQLTAEQTRGGAGPVFHSAAATSARKGGGEKDFPGLCFGTCAHKTGRSQEWKSSEPGAADAGVHV